MVLAFVQKIVKPYVSCSENTILFVARKTPLCLLL